MPNKDVSEAFKILMSKLNEELRSTREEAAQAVRRGDNEAARNLLLRTEEVGTLISDIRDRHRHWHDISKGRKTKSAARRRRVGRLARGERTPEHAYRIPILRALERLGGEARTRDVLAEVYAQMKAQLKPIDLKRLPSGRRMPRWRNTAMWERNSMKEDGLLSDNSPRGTWAITENGRAYLKEHCGQETG